MEEREQARDNESSGSADRASEAAALFSRLSAEDQKTILKEICDLIASRCALPENGNDPADESDAE